MSEIAEGDIVRVRDPRMYKQEFAAKLKDRTGVVLWVGPRPHDMWRNHACVKFHKRNGRGKEFEMIMEKRELVKAESATC